MNELWGNYPLEGIVLWLSGVMGICVGVVWGMDRFWLRPIREYRLWMAMHRHQIRLISKEVIGSQKGIRLIIQYGERWGIGRRVYWVPESLRDVSLEAREYVYRDLMGNLSIVAVDLER